MQAQLNDVWDLVLYIREDNPEYPFILTTLNKETNKSYWDMAMEDENIPAGGLAISNNPHIAQRAFMEKLTFFKQLFIFR